MTTKSELFSPAGSTAQSYARASHFGSTARNLAEIGLVFILILGAVWTPAGRLNLAVTALAMTLVVVFAVIGKFDGREMGLTRPLASAPYILLIGAVACGVIAGIGLMLRHIGASYSVPLQRSWQYAIWALEQEFILQSIFFVRLEDILGDRRAVLGAATLFALVHIPSPVLTPLAFLGGFLFCELFRRWRNLYPLGLIHAALGLTIAASFPDRWLHHMRVGLGYLAFHR